MPTSYQRRQFRSVGDGMLISIFLHPARSSETKNEKEPRESVAPSAKSLMAPCVIQKPHFWASRTLQPSEIQKIDAVGCFIVLARMLLMVHGLVPMDLFGFVFKFSRFIDRTADFIQKVQISG
jgi:hypothetical protein